MLHVRMQRTNANKTNTGNCQNSFYLHLRLEVSQLLLNIPVSVERKRYINNT